MDAKAYLIKQATTVGRLARIAKRHGIPLVGDWRYAAKLLGRQATPKGKAHYRRAAGLIEPGERKILRRLQAKTKDPLAELGVQRLPGERRLGVMGDRTGLEVTEGAVRTVHTHPEAVEKVLGVDLPPFRRNRLGQVFPSSGLDYRYKKFMPKTIREAIADLKKGPYFFKHDLGDLEDNLGLTHAILDPSTGVQSVIKGGRGKLRRLFFKE